MTVQEFVNSSTKSKFWLCPNISASQAITTDSLYQGYECSKHTVPDKVKNKKVLKHFVEDKMDCIIWENVPFVDGHYRYDLCDQPRTSWGDR